MPQLEPAKLARHIASQTRESCSSLEALRAASVTGPRPILRFLGNSAASGRWSDQSGLVSYPEAGKADKPSQLRPLGILRPDAKGLAGTAKDRCLSSLTSPCTIGPSIAYTRRGIIRTLKLPLASNKDASSLLHSSPCSRADSCTPLSASSAGTLSRNFLQGMPMTSRCIALSA